MTGKKRSNDHVGDRGVSAKRSRVENDDGGEASSRVTVKVVNGAKATPGARVMFETPNDRDIIATGNIHVTVEDTVPTLRDKIMGLILVHFPAYEGSFEYVNFVPDIFPFLPVMMQRDVRQLPEFFRIEVIYVRLTELANQNSSMLKGKTTNSRSDFQGLVMEVIEDVIDELRNRLDPQRPGGRTEEEDDEEEESLSEKSVILWRTDDEDPLTILSQSIDKHFQSFVGLDVLRKKANEIAEDAYFNWLDSNKTSHPGHILITGNPGVGKTTGAIALAHFLIKAGLVLSDTVVEAHRDDLIDKYVGGTEEKTNDVIFSAAGGVVIFDEIYTLYKPCLKNDTGTEALSTIMKHMTRESAPVFMFLGYKNHMKEFINMNPGFQRRVRYTIEMDDYSCEELSNIAQRKLSEKKSVQTEESVPYEHYFRCLPRSYLQLHNATVAMRFIEYALQSARERVLERPFNERRGSTVVTTLDFDSAFQRIKKESEDPSNSLNHSIRGMYM